MKRTRTLAASGAWLGAGVLLLAVDVYFDRVLADGSLRQLFLLCACNAVVAMSLNIVNGMAGQFSIGHAGFVGAGAYAAAVVSSELHTWFSFGEPTLLHAMVIVPASLAAAGALAACLGVAVGLPSLRLRGDYLAIVTLGFAEILRLVVGTARASASETLSQAWGAFRERGSFSAWWHLFAVAIERLGGQNGYAGPRNQGVPLYAGPAWVFGVALVVGVAAWRLKFSAWGTALRALREDEIAAASVGIDPARYRLTAFVLAASLGGVAGGLLATMRDGSPVVHPDAFGFQASFDAVTMVILGGSGSVTGAALGALVLTLSMRAIEWAQGTALVQSIGESGGGLDLNALRMIAYAAVLLALMVWRPRGLLGEHELTLARAPFGAPRPPS